MKEKILKLRSQGRTYNEIQKELGCSKSTISFHCGEGQKEKNRIRTKKAHKKRRLDHKIYCFRNRRFRSGVRDFQRRANGHVKNRQEMNFTVSDVINKIGTDPVCYLSGEKIDLKESKSYHFDHIVPASRGGLNVLDNLGVLCKQVNLMKHDLTVEEFIDWCKRILKHQGYRVYKRKAVGYALAEPVC